MAKNREKALGGLVVAGVIAGGIYLLTRKAEATGKIGDLNDDGIVNALDLTLLERYIGGLSVSTPLSEAEFLWRADVNGDGTVNALDITVLEILIAGGGGRP